jgi:DNA-binding XRE family transcriptional regulator
VLPIGNKFLKTIIPMIFGVTATCPVADWQHVRRFVLRVGYVLPTVPHMTQSVRAERATTDRPTIRLKLDNWHKACRAAGLVSQAQRAAALRLNRATIVRLENGQRDPSTEVIAAILSGFPGAVFNYFFRVASS